MDKTIMHLIILLIFIVLVSCQQQLSYDYLIKHPEFLEKEAVLCQTNPHEKCKMIMNTMNKLVIMSEIQYVHPQKFGEMIMKTQFDIGQLQKKVDDMKAQETIDSKELQQVEKDHSVLEQRLQLFMAVLSKARLN